MEIFIMFILEHYYETSKNYYVDGKKGGCASNNADWTSYYAYHFASGYFTRGFLASPAEFSNRDGCHQHIFLIMRIAS